LGITEIWTTFFLQPMLNSLLWLYSVLGHNFALSITVFTIIVRLITLPLTIPQMTSSRKMQELQPKLKELQNKFKDDKEGLSRAQMELYKQSGVNPMGGCLPTLVQFPIWIGLYQSIYQVMAVNPLQVLQLSENIYLHFPNLTQLIPLNDHFLWLNLGRPDPYYILPILVAASMFFQQRLMTTPSSDASTASMMQSMNYTMPLMFGFFSLGFSSGLSIYFIVSSLVGIAIQLGLNKFMGLGPVTQSTGLSSKSKQDVEQKSSVAEPKSRPSADLTRPAVESVKQNLSPARRSVALNDSTAEKGKRKRARKKRR